MSVVHLIRDAYDGEEDRGVAWCGTECGQDVRRNLNPPRLAQAVDEIGAATCIDCLESARVFGEQCRQRAERLRRGLPEQWTCPRCKLTYGGSSDSSVAHRERGQVHCIACAEHR